MSINKLALIRYRTIDACLRNRYRKWTLDDLIEKVAEKLEEYEGIQSGVSKRTVQADIQLMRSDKLGYNAPIIVKERKYYCYEDADYSIMQSPISPTDLDTMKEVVSLLQQLNGFAHFEEMTDMIARLENTLNSSNKKQASCIQLESNRLLKGLEFISPLYQAILHKKAVQIMYKSFKAKEPRVAVYFPYLLKEYRNRWFLVTKERKSAGLLNLALDRMLSVDEFAREKFQEYQGVNFERYFDDLIGVTKTERDRAYKVILKIDAVNAPYVLTKPLHPSQVVMNEDATGIIIRIDVVLNYELEREILGFGDGMQVLAPRLLEKKIRLRLKNAFLQYQQADQRG